jgi:hypothetical protein
VAPRSGGRQALQAKEKEKEKEKENYRLRQ